MRIVILSLAVLLIIMPITINALEIGENLSISGTVTGTYQWLRMKDGFVNDDGKTKRLNRGSAVIDFGVSFKPF